MSDPTSDPIGCGPMPDAAQEAGGAVAGEARNKLIELHKEYLSDAYSTFGLHLSSVKSRELCDVLLDAAIALDKLAAAQRTAQREPVAWQSGDTVPTINDGTEREFILAVRRARTGKVYTFACMYLNRYRLQYQDDCGACDNSCEDGDGCATTGWFELSGDDDYEYMYRALSLYEGDKIEGWRELPRWEAAPPPPAAGAQAEAMRMALVAEAVGLFRAFARGVADKRRSEGRATADESNLWLEDSCKTFRSNLAQIEAPGAEGK